MESYPQFHYAWDRRPQGTAQQVEKRRRQVIPLLKAGKNLSAMIRVASTSVSSASDRRQTY